jgi:hypothetical protein
MRVLKHATNIVFIGMTPFHAKSGGIVAPLAVSVNQLIKPD